jgi:Peptidase C13 family
MLTPHWTRHVRTLLFCLTALALVGCAVSPTSSSQAARSEALWQAQLDKVSRASAAGTPDLWVVLAGLHDGSKAFEGDVVAMEQAIFRINPKARVLSLNNPHVGGDLNRPFGTRDNLARALRTIGQKAKAGDSVLVFLTTHGHINVLANAAGGVDYPLITGQDLRQMLLPLGDLHTGIIVSACHSGSLIPALRAPKRWVMTAAAYDRSSFGCNFWGKQTFFVQALLRHMEQQHMQLANWFGAARASVTAMEQEAKLSPPSNPQLWVGTESQALLKQAGPSSFLTP